jgi:hypothetical protein
VSGRRSARALRALDGDHHDFDVAALPRQHLPRAAPRLVEAAFAVLHRLHARRDVEDEHGAAGLDRRSVLRPERARHDQAERGEQSELQREQQIGTKSAALRIVAHLLPEEQARDLHLALMAPP